MTYRYGFFVRWIPTNADNAEPRSREVYLFNTQAEAAWGLWNKLNRLDAEDAIVLEAYTQERPNP